MGEHPDIDLYTLRILYNWPMIIVVYVIQFLVHVTTDTRNSKFQLVLNHLVFWMSAVLTVITLGWSYIWIPPILLLASAVVAGIIGGIAARNQKPESDSVFSSLSSPDDALLVQDVRAEYVYLRSRLEGFDYKVVNVTTKDINDTTYDILTVQDIATGNLHDFYFDASHAMEHASGNLDKLLKERKEKDRTAVVEWLESNDYENVDEIWEESFNLTTEVSDIKKEKGFLSEDLLREELGVSDDVAAAIMFRFHFRGWLNDDESSES